MMVKMMIEIMKGFVFFTGNECPTAAKDGTVLMMMMMMMIIVMKAISTIMVLLKSA